jgi:hypothetical protein
MLVQFTVALPPEAHLEVPSGEHVVADGHKTNSKFFISNNVMEFTAAFSSLLPLTLKFRVVSAC